MSSINATWERVHRNKNDLIVKKLCVNVPSKVLYSESDISLTFGNKYGIIGNNGSGKSTLLSILKEIYGSDAYTLQQFSDNGSLESVIDSVLRSDTEAVALRKRLDKLNGDDDTDDCFEYTDEVLEEIQEIEDRLKFKSQKHDAMKILAGLGFDSVKIQGQTCELSGGWNQRLCLAKALFSQPNVLMLDEPCNHLDYNGILWLSEYLEHYKNTVIVVAHDIHFLDQFCNWFICVHNKELKYLKNIESVFKFMKIDDETYFEFDESSYTVRKSASIKVLDVSFAYDNQKNILQDIDLNIDCKDRFVITGQNGCGKSTLLKLIAGNLQPTMGRIEKDFQLRVLYLDQHSIAKINTDITPLQFLKGLYSNETTTELHKAMSKFGVAKENRIKKLTLLSGGEKARILYAMIALKQAHILLLDEPSNHLDIESTFALASALKHFKGGVLIVTHNNILIDSIRNDKTKIMNIEKCLLKFI
jgi:ATPase subunit of ABC transporter with duplicated ATPase domains